MPVLGLISPHLPPIGTAHIPSPLPFPSTSCTSLLRTLDLFTAAAATVAAAGQLGIGSTAGDDGDNSIIWRVAQFNARAGVGSGQVTGQPGPVQGQKQRPLSTSTPFVRAGKYVNLNPWIGL